MWPIWDELKKHRAFREVWIGYLLGGAFFLLALYQTSGRDRWFLIQQDIYTYGDTLTAFLLVIGLSRLMCCEHEYGTDRLIKTSERGSFLIWRIKALFAVAYCTIVVLVIGTVSLLLHGGQMGFQDALVPTSETSVPSFGPVPMTNLNYCIMQYVFLFLGAVYFAGLILLVAQLTQHTALTIFLCGGAYVALLGYYFVGHLWTQGTPLHIITEFLFRFSFAGFMSLESFNWRYCGEWSQVWKPVVIVILLAGLEFTASWLLWRRRAQK